MQSHVVNAKHAIVQYIATVVLKSHARAFHANAKTGVCVEGARAQFASRCGGGRSMQPFCCAPFRKRCAMM
eukprot:5674191-Lingulodinium_polyedra.AAC.1